MRRELRWIFVLQRLLERRIELILGLTDSQADDLPLGPPFLSMKPSQSHIRARTSRRRKETKNENVAETKTETEPGRWLHTSLQICNDTRGDRREYAEQCDLCEGKPANASFEIRVSRDAKRIRAC